MISAARSAAWLVSPICSVPNRSKHVWMEGGKHVGVRTSHTALGFHSLRRKANFLVMSWRSDLGFPHTHWAVVKPSPSRAVWEMAHETWGNYNLGDPHRAQPLLTTSWEEGSSPMTYSATTQMCHSRNIGFPRPALCCITLTIAESPRSFAQGEFVYRFTWAAPSPLRGSDSIAHIHANLLPARIGKCIELPQWMLLLC